MKDEYLISRAEFDKLLDSLPKKPVDNQQVNRSAKAEQVTGPALLADSEEQQHMGLTSHYFFFTWKDNEGEWLCDKLIKIKSA